MESKMKILKMVLRMTFQMTLSILDIVEEYLKHKR